MTCIKRKGGWVIKLESGRILPKIYTSLSLCKKRVAQLIAHRDK